MGAALVEELIRPEPPEMIRPQIQDDRWQLRAACCDSNEEFEVGDPENQKSTYAEDRLIALYCDGCAVRQDCLAAALLRRDRYAVYGGLGPFERKSLHQSMYEVGKITVAQWESRHAYETKPNDILGVAGDQSTQTILGKLESVNIPNPTKPKVPEDIEELFIKYNVDGTKSLRAQIKLRQTEQRKLMHSTDDADTLKKLAVEIEELYVCLDAIRTAQTQALVHDLTVSAR